MNSRRKFIGNISLSAVGIGLTNITTISCATEQGTQENMESSENGFPLVISTWNNVKANEAAWAKIEAHQSALDAVEAGAKVPEADTEDRSVGHGGRPDRDGEVTLDACIMDEKGNAGSVCYLKEIKHPIAVARKVMEETPHVMLAGAGALQFAMEQGFERINLLTDQSKVEWEKWLEKKEYKPVANIELHDTIGILAIDEKGNLSGACTTSGMAYKMKGRVGDSPIIGAGLFVDNEVGAATATGLGEAVLKSCGAFLVVELMRQGKSPAEACKEAVLRIVQKQDAGDIQVGYLAINKRGEVGGYSVQSGFMYALTRNGATTVLDAPHFQK